MQYDPDIICQAGVLEYIDCTCNYYAIPTWILGKYGFSASNPHKNHDGSLCNNFDYLNMLYQVPISPGAIGPENQNSAADITQIETQMWYLFLATKYIDAGFEAISFGDIFIVDVLDRANDRHDYWSLILNVREYATAHARRGVVICSATATAGSYMNGNVVVDFNDIGLP